MKLKQESARVESVFVMGKNPHIKKKILIKVNIYNVHIKVVNQ